MPRRSMKKPRSSSAYTSCMAPTRVVSESIRQHAISAMAEYFIVPTAMMGILSEELLVPVVRSLQQRVDTEIPAHKILINYRKLESGLFQLGYVIIDHSVRARATAKKGETVWLE